MKFIRVHSWRYLQRQWHWAVYPWARGWCSCWRWRGCGRRWASASSGRRDCCCWWLRAAHRALALCTPARDCVFNTALDIGRAKSDREVRECKRARERERAGGKENLRGWVFLGYWWDGQELEIEAQGISKWASSLLLDCRLDWTLFRIRGF